MYQKYKKVCLRHKLRMAPDRLARNVDFLKVLAKAPPKQRQAIIGTANSDLILCLCECALNLLNGNIKISDSVLRKLQRHKNSLRNLADRKVPKAEKITVLQQKGGFLPALIAPVLGILGQLLVDNIVRK